MNVPSRTSVDYMCLRDDVENSMHVRIVSGVVFWVVFIEYSGQDFMVELEEYPDSNKVQQIIYAVAQYVHNIGEAGRILKDLEIEVQS